MAKTQTSTKVFFRYRNGLELSIKPKKVHKNLMAQYLTAATAYCKNCKTLKANSCSTDGQILCWPADIFHFNKMFQFTVLYLRNLAPDFSFTVLVELLRGNSIFKLLFHSGIQHVVPGDRDRIAQFSASGFFINSNQLNK